MVYKKILKQQLYKRGWGPINHVYQKKENPTSIYNSEISALGIQYTERKGSNALSFSDKKKKEIEEKTFEKPDFIALNQAISCFIKHAKSIVNIGSGVGTFEWFASVDNSLTFTAVEFDKGNIEWSKKHRQRKNITYCSTPMSELIKDKKKFDLAVSLDVIDHIYEFGTFLSEFSTLADRGIISITNKDRAFQTSIAETPQESSYCREWNAGEFYWVLRAFYKNVQLYSLPDPFVPKVEKIGFMSTLSPVIAVCSR